ncbi:AMP-binding protein [Sporosarcina sp. Marseille-Q4063]|uniref:AMP-binding protein n=1 Tax=Sporosarcina sp. Marseille-Q4063 TaxID=2810514 RepID=UPI001BAEF5E6|nr:AMP-binding protein [Sporosarcina sp. Marseille-Q4063]QUW21317.1 AMP-binding protein [Sporosarcina sp. Marseille-Q4063]
MSIKTNLLKRSLIGDSLKRSSYRYPTKTALIFYDSQEQQITYTFEELNNEVNQTANSLLEMGIEKGDRIAVIGRNNSEIVVLSYALIKIGAWYTPLNFMFNSEEVKQLIQFSKPRMFFVDKEYIELVQSIESELSEVETIFSLRTTEIPSGWEDFSQLKKGNANEVEVAIDDENVAALFYTSGTESAPKGVMVSHRNCLYTNYSYMAAGAFQPDDILMLSLPLIHIAGFALMLNAHMVGLTVVMTDIPVPSRIAMLMERHKVTLTALPPTLYLAILKEADQHNLSSLQKLITWSSTIPKSMVDGWNEASPKARFFTIQGSSETTGSPLTGSWFKTWDEVPNGDGRYVGRVSHTGCEIKLIDELGKEVPDGEPGEQIARGPVVVSGYYNDEEANNRAFRDGWFHTGDVLIRDRDGNYYFADRKKDIVKTGGENVSSQEVENVLSNHPHIYQCAVFGIPDTRWGEAVVAAVVLKSGVILSEEEVIDYCRIRLSGFKLPKFVVFRSELPLTSAGKLLKRSLKDEYKNLSLKMI